MAFPPTGPPGQRLSARAKDLAVTLAVTAVAAGGALWGMRGESETLWQAVAGWSLLAIACGALHFRRRRPIGVAVVTLLACAAYFPVSANDGPVVLAFIVALYTAAVDGRFAAAAALGVVAMLLVVYGEVLQEPGRRKVDDMSIMMLAGWLLSLLVLARAQRTRAAYLEEVRRRALAAEREQEALALQSASEERLRIAREVHDVLGHSISLINVQSSAALHRISKHRSRAEDTAEGRTPASDKAAPDHAGADSPAPSRAASDSTASDHAASDSPAPGQTAAGGALVIAEEALEAVKSTSRQALAELRSTLGMLRRSDESAPTAPTAGLDRLPELLAGARSAGLDVRAETVGAPRPLPPPLDLAAYRIVQESLTNVARHARACVVTVTLAYSADELQLRIDDDGQGSPDELAHGSGIRGMAERAKAFGGELTAHNTADGFRVSARLPLSEPFEGEL